MERLLQEFEQTVTDAKGDTYRVFLHGRSRPGDTWQGWLRFERLSDGQQLTTEAETTQSSEDAVLYWATGLGGAYFDGALERAKRATRADPTPLPAPEALVDGRSGRETRAHRLAKLEHEILDIFRRRHSKRLLTQTLFSELPHAHADIVRALEDLEKGRQLLIRQTESGNDWILLSRAGLEATGFSPLALGDTNDGASLR